MLLKQEVSFCISKGNLVLFQGHLKGHNTIKNHYKSNLYGMVDQQQDTNVYLIKPLSGKCPLLKFNHLQLYDLQKTKHELKDLPDLGIHTNVPLDVFTKFHQAFLIPNQKTITITKLLMDK